MPRLPRLHEPVLRDLLDQGRFAARPATLRQLGAAEAMAAEIDPGAAYPESWIVFRVTGYRPDPAGEAGTARPDRVLSGAALLAALAPFAIHLSDRARPLGSETPDGSAGVDELASRWGVSAPTVQRLREDGLVGRWVYRADADGRAGGRPRLVFVPAVIEATERRCAGRLARARGFARLPDATTARLVRRARRYRARLGWSLHRVAVRLAERHGLATETVRAALLRSELVVGSEPVFPAPRPATRRDRVLGARAFARGVPVGEIAERLGRKVPATRRLVLLERAARLDELTAWISEPPEPPEPSGTDANADADAFLTHPLLAPEPVRADLGQPGATELVALLESIANAPVPVLYAETARLHALAFLQQAARSIAVANRTSTPSAEAIDAGETALRWASRLKAELVRQHFGTLHRAWTDADPVADRTAPEAGRLLVACLDAMGEAIDRASLRVEIDAPPPAGRLAGGVGLAIARTLARDPRPSASSRARRRLLPGTPVPDWTRRVHPWQATLDPTPGVCAVVRDGDRGQSGTIPAINAELLARRFGLGAHTPHTVAMLASRAGEPVMRLSRRLQGAIRGARRASWRQTGVVVAEDAGTMTP